MHIIYIADFVNCCNRIGCWTYKGLSPRFHEVMTLKSGPKENLFGPDVDNSSFHVRHHPLRCEMLRDLVTPITADKPVRLSQHAQADHEY